jgi:hypothetical protein
VSSASPRAPSFSRGSRSLFRFFANRLTPTVPALAPVKALKLWMPATTRRCSERVPRSAVSATAAAGESSRVVTAAARPQQEEAVVAASQVLVPTPLPKGAGRLVRRAGPPGTTGQWGPLLMVILPPGGANRGGDPGQPPSACQRCW